MRSTPLWSRASADLRCRRRRPRPPRPALPGSEPRRRGPGCRRIGRTRARLGAAIRARARAAGVCASSCRGAAMTQALATLADRVTGRVIRPGDEGYEEARRVYNGMLDARPAAVVRCATAQDVVAVVRHARDRRAELAVRGGAHSVPGFGTKDGVVVADLLLMQQVDVDDAAATVTAGGGTTLGRLNDV